MVRLDKQIDFKSKDEEQNSAINSKSLMLFTQRILNKMQKDKVLPTPNNFQIYFETSLENADEEFKTAINNIRQHESSLQSDEHYMQMERDIKESFSSIKQMISSMSLVYKNIAVAKGFIKKHSKELVSTTNNLALKNITSSLDKNMNQFDKMLQTQLNSIKINYDKTINSLKNIEQEAIFDTRYEIYNKRFLLKAIQIEKNAAKKHNHHSSLMTLKVQNELLLSIPRVKDRLALTKNIAKLLQKTSKRSDVIAYYGDGIFAMLMKHTDINSAKLAAQRVSDLIYNSSFFIGDMDIQIDIQMAVTSIDTQSSVEENIVTLLDAMPKSSKNTQKFIVVEQTKQEDFLW